MKSWVGCKDAQSGKFQIYDVTPMSDPTLANFVKSLAATAVGAKIVGPVTALDYGEMLANVQRAFPEYED